MIAGIGMLFYILLWIAITAFLLTMLYRFVRAVERIADKFERGITVIKEEAP